MISPPGCIDAPETNTNRDILGKLDRSATQKSCLLAETATAKNIAASFENRGRWWFWCIGDRLSPGKQRYISADVLSDQHEPRSLRTLRPVSTAEKLYQAETATAGI